MLAELEEEMKKCTFKFYGWMCDYDFHPMECKKEGCLHETCKPYFEHGTLGFTGVHAQDQKYIFEDYREVSCDYAHHANKHNALQVDSRNKAKWTKMYKRVLMFNTEEGGLKIKSILLALKQECAHTFVDQEKYIPNGSGTQEPSLLDLPIIKFSVRIRESNGECWIGQYEVFISEAVYNYFYN